MFCLTRVGTSRASGLGAGAIALGQGTGTQVTEGGDPSKQLLVLGVQCVERGRHQDTSSERLNGFQKGRLPFTQSVPAEVNLETFTILTYTPVPGYHLTEALSKRHPRGASVASLRLFTIYRNGVHVRRNPHTATAVDRARQGGRISTACALRNER